MSIDRSMPRPRDRTLLNIIVPLLATFALLMGPLAGIGGATHTTDGSTTYLGEEGGENRCTSFAFHYDDGTSDIGRICTDDAGRGSVNEVSPDQVSGLHAASLHLSCSADYTLEPMVAAADGGPDLTVVEWSMSRDGDSDNGKTCGSPQVLEGNTLVVCPTDGDDRTGVEVVMSYQGADGTPAVTVTVSDGDDFSEAVVLPNDGSQVTEFIEAADGETLDITVSREVDGSTYTFYSASILVDCGVPAPVLTFAKSVTEGASDEVDIDGGSTGYTLIGGNTGDGAATDVTITDDLPDVFDIVGTPSFSIDGGTSTDCVVSGNNVVTCSAIDLDAGQEVVVTIDVTVADDAHTCAAVDNTATLTHDGNDIDDDATVNLVGCSGEVTGEVTIIKNVTGNDVPSGLGDFEFELVCDNETYEDAILLADDDSVTIDGLPHGLGDCTVEEVEDHQADSTTWDVASERTNTDGNGTTSGAFSVHSGEPVTVTFTNTFNSTSTPPPPPPPPGDGEVTVAKVVDGDAPDDIGDFEFDLVCDAATEAEFGLADGETATNDVDDDSTCTVEETNDQAAVETTWIIAGVGDADITGTGTVTDSFDVDEDDEITVTFTNAYPEVAGEIEFESNISIVKTAIAGVDEDEGILSVTLGDDDEATVTYRYLITNEGEDDLVDLDLEDDKLGDLTAAFVAAVEAEFGEAVLPVEGSVTVDADHTVTIGDFDEGGDLVNLATVTGTGTESGDVVTDEDDESIALVRVLGESQDADEDDEETDEGEEETLPRTGTETTALIAAGLLSAALGMVALTLTGRKRREEWIR